MNNGTGSLPATDVSYSAAFSYTDFPNANDTLQGTPHGDVHVDIGGWMHDVPTAGQDPIFYLHHCNIYRLWNLWLAQGGGRTDPLNDSAWKNTKSTFFNENGDQVQMSACEVLRCAQQLNYTYEGEPAEVNENCIRFRVFPIYLQEVMLFRSPLPPIELSSDPVSFPLELKDLRQRVATLAESKTERLRLSLDVEAERQPGVVWEVYVGLPANAEPDPESPFYVGNISLFGSGIRSQARHEFKPAHFAFTVNRALQAALKRNEERLQVTFVPHGILINGKLTRPKVESSAKVSQVTLTVATEKQQRQ
jgi:tyrosinase